ncbi:MAG: hypothetical protein DWQ47_03250 [Acidobacteria bacterium]|nr:MAG: hypothetical protein DWQ32_06800 [Acidobacteriota bacterium]REK01420.1 MAG: hypothetical protein DWQ38_03235 [Acidobacteriota bacterium]REK14376.1 MAG: hypothetical protein DWQ43_12490 [Acidobacteriota bacterium]REK45091.1 MAG: hypothetical protein DWQ47_03250 [Acidobacteriota bacterium]
MENTFLTGVAAWVIPGGGYFVQKRWIRGAVVSGSIFAMFFIALASGGHYYPGLKFEEGALLYLLNIFARLGSGFIAGVSYLVGTNPPPDAAGAATFEYGGRFLEVAGLLNYLAIVDSLDLLKGRKE